MTQLPFEDLPPGPIEVVCEFDEFWKLYPRKVSKLKTITAYNKALKVAAHDEIMEGVRRYIANKPGYADWAHPPTWLNAGRWMDEYDTPKRQPDTPESLANIAAHVKKPWYEFGKYPREKLQACVDAELLTQEEAEAKS